MMPWFLRDPERLQRERAGVEQLSRSAKWLVGTEWHLDSELCLDAIIRAHGHDYDVRVSFPTLYPDAPAVVRPRNTTRRISYHQYGGADGPLCLEWGPDNWHRDVTAVQMLESAHRLFDIENPLGEDHPEVPVVAASRHQLTVGQLLRGEWARWYAAGTLTDYFTSQPIHSVGSFKFSFRKAGGNWVALVQEAVPLGTNNAWRDSQIPVTFPGEEMMEPYIGIWFKTELEGADIGQCSTLAELKTLLVDIDGGKVLSTDGTSPVEGFQRAITGVLIIDRAGVLHFFIVFSGEKIITCSMVRSQASQVQLRSPEWDELNGKTIGIVGLGSVGSKIAMSLTRMGVRKFYMVDHDVLLPENLQRHALDWQGVVQHKVDAMTMAIGRVAPTAQLEVCRLHLTGQESNAAVSGALNCLAECDLLIDATANSKVFNLLAAVARTAGRPMIWLEVFGGGMGGLIARSRPRTDPTPQDMRGAYLQYCIDNPSPVLRPTSDTYEAETEDGEMMVASDADVSVIAHHAARFVPDCFTPPEHSKFPYSMYLVGLAKGWVFEAPFATIPISMASHTLAGWHKGEKTEFGSGNEEFLLGLMKKNDNAADNTT